MLGAFSLVFAALFAGFSRFSFLNLPQKAQADRHRQRPHKKLDTFLRSNCTGWGRVLGCCAYCFMCWSLSTMQSNTLRSSAAAARYFVMFLMILIATRPFEELQSHAK